MPFSSGPITVNGSTRGLLTKKPDTFSGASLRARQRIIMTPKDMITRVSAICLSLLVSLFAPVAFAEESVASVITALGLRESAVPARDMKGWETLHKIVVLSDSADRLAWLQQVAPGVSVVGARSRADAMAQVADADGLIGLCDADVINAGARLRWIQTLSAGVENCLAIPKVHNGGIILTNMQRVNGPNISEHTMALILALTRQINAYLVNQSEGKWDRHPLGQLMDLDDHTMLVVGLGGIGITIAERAHAFGMHVIATRNNGH